MTFLAKRPNYLRLKATMDNQLLRVRFRKDELYACVHGHQLDYYFYSLLLLLDLREVTMRPSPVEMKCVSQ